MSSLSPQKTTHNSLGRKATQISKSQSAISPFEFTSSMASDAYEEELLASNSNSVIGTDTRIRNLNGLKETYEIDKKMGDPYIKLKIENLWNFKKEPLENYDIQRLNEEDPEELINSRGGTRGLSKFMNEAGKIVWKECEVLDYNKETNMYLIRWRESGFTKEVSLSHVLCLFCVG